MKLIQSFLIEYNRNVGIRSLKDLVKNPTFRKKHKRLSDTLKKKLISGSFDSELAFGAYKNLIEQFASGYPEDIIEEVAAYFYEEEDVEVGEETDSEMKVKDVVSSVFNGTTVTMQDDHGTAVATLEFDDINSIRKNFPSIYDAVKNKLTNARLLVYLSTLGIGFSLFNIEDDGSEDKYADTDLYGDYPSSAAANRIIALLNNNSNIQRVLKELKENG